MRIMRAAITEPGQAGLHYREGKANACPCCGGSQWLVGRVTAECADCAMPLPLKGTTILSVVKADTARAIPQRSIRTG